MTGLVRITLVHVKTRASVTGQRVADRTGTAERAGCVATLELTRYRRDKGLALVYVDTLTLPLTDVHLVASVTEAAV